MKHEFFKRPVIPTSWLVASVIAVVSIITYQIWINFLNSGTVIFMSILILIVVILFLLNEMIIVDMGNQILMKETKFAGQFVVSRKNKVNLNSITLAYLNQSKYRRTITNPRSFHSLNVTGYEYLGYLSINDNNSYYLGSSLSHDFCSAQLKKIASLCKVEFLDNTSS